MGEAFEKAWFVLKFQPSQGVPLGEGANQLVYAKEGDPNVAKVGGAHTLEDMYYLNRLGAERPDVFVPQRLIPITRQLPMEALARFGTRVPVLSVQERGKPLEASGMTPRRESAIGSSMVFDQPGGELFEALGLADAKFPNWMERLQPATGGISVGSLTGNPSRTGQAFLMDPMFYGPENPKSGDAALSAQLARGTPRRLGVDYTVPEEQVESFARRVDELPFMEFVDPAFAEEVPMRDSQAALLHDIVGEQDERIKTNLGKIGVF